MRRTIIAALTAGTLACALAACAESPVTEATPEGGVSEAAGDSVSAPTLATQQPDAGAESTPLAPSSDRH